MEKTSSQQHIGAMELLGVGGFSCYFGYALLSFFWLYTFYPPGYSGFERGIVQMGVFIALPATLIGISLFKKQLIASAPARQVLFWAAFACALVMPLEVLAAYLGIELPFAAALGGALLNGVAGGYFTLRWLDGCGSARIHRYLRFTSAGVAGGAVLFFLVYLIPAVLQPLFAIGYITLSFLLLLFLQARTNPTEGMTVKPRREFLPFSRDIEPSIFIYGVVFGLGFALTFIEGEAAVLVGMVAVLVGAAVVLVLDIAGFSISITVTQRAILVVTVAACLIIASGVEALLSAGLGLVVGAWGAFSAVNWAMLVRKSVAQRTHVFFAVASGASIATLGFLLGWIISLAYALLDFNQTFLTTTMLLMAFVLVLITMLFFPNSQHHDEQADAPAPKPEAVRITAGEVSEKELYLLQVEAVSKLYGLSPRESDVLAYLAKGRNANYIQKELTVSPHTAKSHIYNIYRKLDIHSQQKLMDFIEEYPVELR